MLPLGRRNPVGPSTNRCVAAIAAVAANPVGSPPPAFLRSSTSTICSPSSSKTFPRCCPSCHSVLQEDEEGAESAEGADGADRAEGANEEEVADEEEAADEGGERDASLRERAAQPGDTSASMQPAHTSASGSMTSSRYALRGVPAREGGARGVVEGFMVEGVMVVELIVECWQGQRHPRNLLATRVQHMYLT